MKRLFFYLILGIVLVLNLNSLCFAQLTLDKREIKAVIKPGEKLRGNITVMNPSDEDAMVKAYFEDFVYAPPYKGIKEFRALGSTPRSSGKWMSVIPDLFLVPGNSKQVINYTINVPADAKGSYFAILFFETGTGAPTSGNTVGMGVNFRTGCSFYLEPKDKIYKVKMEDVSVAKDGIRGEFLNAGNVLLISDTTYHIMGDKGIVLDRGKMMKFYLPPEEKAPFNIKPGKQIPDGTFILVINFAQEGAKALVKEIDFSKDKDRGIRILGVKD